jgi:hypothetical protein
LDTLVGAVWVAVIEAFVFDAMRAGPGPVLSETAVAVAVR